MAKAKSNSGNNNQIYAKIVSTFKDKNRADISKWRNALSSAENYMRPSSKELQDLYENLCEDGHFIAQTGLRKASTTGYGFSIVNKQNGDIDSEKTEYFNSEWFYDFMDNILNSVLFGYTIMELQDPTSMKFELIPRRNVIAKKHMILLNDSGDKFIDYSTGFDNTLIHCGNPLDLGLMSKLCGILIWKRNSIQSWAEFTEKFGMPLISATTSRTDPTNVAKLNQMLQALGEAATAVLPEGTTVSVTPFTTGDSYHVYDSMCERMDNELSKAIVGGTMNTDNGSSRSQAEVHERNLDDKIAATDRRMVQFVVNNQLIPMMQFWGWNINSETDKFLFDTSFELTLSEHWNIVNEVMQRYEVEVNWLSKTFNIPIVGERKDNVSDTEPKGNLSKNFR